MPVWQKVRSTPNAKRPAPLRCQLGPKRPGKHHACVALGAEASYLFRARWTFLGPGRSSCVCIIRDVPARQQPRKVSGVLTCPWLPVLPTLITFFCQRILCSCPPSASRPQLVVTIFKKISTTTPKRYLRVFLSPCSIQAGMDHAAGVGDPQFRWRGGKEGHQAQCKCTQSSIFFIFFGRFLYSHSPIYLLPMQLWLEPIPHTIGMSALLNGTASGLGAGSSALAGNWSSTDAGRTGPPQFSKIELSMVLHHTELFDE